MVDSMLHGVPPVTCRRFTKAQRGGHRGMLDGFCRWGGPGWAGLSVEGLRDITRSCVSPRRYIRLSMLQHLLPGTTWPILNGLAKMPRRASPSLVFCAHPLPYSML